MFAAFRGLWRHRTLPADASRKQSAEWLHETCVRGLRAIHVQLEVHGTPPSHGLVVSNHLTYLDILCYSAAVPCVFVSKAEIEEWPIFGKYARWSGSVFVRRHDRGDAARANVNVSQSLSDGVPVVLFPEGTTTDGHRILRFHSTMLQPAIDIGARIAPCAIHYDLDNGDPAREVSWYGDMPLLPHFWNLASKKSIHARIVFGDALMAAGDRKQLSHTLHEQVVHLYRDGSAVEPVASASGQQIR
ncbi:MAG TPA: lysophospholipid acyltransferase family protein [Terriglobales bacterium]|jgi:1-acyl-sn-glycerol-3-phosphate acyltransferase